MTTIAEVRDAMALAIAEGTDLRGLAYQTSSLPHPCAVVTPGAYDPRMVLGKSKTTFTFRVSVVVGPVAEIQAQKRCDSLREPSGVNSLVAAIENGDLWSITVDYASVLNVGEAGEVTTADETLLAFELEVEVVW